MMSVQSLLLSMAIFISSVACVCLNLSILNSHATPMPLPGVRETVPQKEVNPEPPSCVPRTDKPVFFRHLRKCGGTAIKTFLTQFSLRNDLPLQVAEPSDHYFNFMGPGVTTVISVRDPVERVVSSFFYEGRTEACDVKGNREGTCKPDFMTWIEDVDNDADIRWFCVYNCLTRFVLGYPSSKSHYGSNVAITRVDLALAKAVLDHFDVLLTTEGLNEPETKEYLGMLFPGDSIKTVEAWAAPSRPRWELPEEALRTVRRGNAIDFELYAYAKQLFLQRRAHCVVGGAQRSEAMLSFVGK